MNKLIGFDLVNIIIKLIFLRNQVDSVKSRNRFNDSWSNNSNLMTILEMEFNFNTMNKTQGSMNSDERMTKWTQSETLSEELYQRS